MERVKNDGKIFDTTLTPSGKGQNYSAGDAQGTFTGTVTFTNAALTAWAYNITMKNGSGSIKGRGWLDKEGLRTEKIFSDPRGTPRARIVETLKEITAAEYNRLSAQDVTEPAVAPGAPKAPAAPKAPSAPTASKAPSAPSAPTAPTAS
ncbi:hypothetical protein KKF84_07195 [Myxococcota bacterium]|nr:hypothetical protein [Myxococcota bacterium]MBU1535088.1 hypothetical protein [Myxococcota bacterium]